MNPLSQPEEFGSSVYDLQPHGRHGALVEQRGLGEGTQGIQRLLQQLTAQVRVVTYTQRHSRDLATYNYYLQLSDVRVFYCRED